MATRTQPSNWDLICSFTLSAEDLGQLLGCTGRHVRECLVDDHGNKVTWSDVDHTTTRVWFEWPDGLRLRARRNRNGDLMFLTAEARETFGLEISRAIHPSNAGL